MGKASPVIKEEAAKLTARLGKGRDAAEKERSPGWGQLSRRASRAKGGRGGRAPGVSCRERATGGGSGCRDTLDSPKGATHSTAREPAQPKQSVVQELVRDAAARDPTQGRPWVEVMDGALGLWALGASVLADVEYVGILDILHVIEYLWTAGKALHGEGSKSTASRVHAQLLKILQGHVGRVIGGLKQQRRKLQLTAAQRKALTQAITYFENHRQWMRYDVYLVSRLSYRQRGGGIDLRTYRQRSHGGQRTALVDCRGGSHPCCSGQSSPAMIGTRTGSPICSRSR